MAEAMAAPQVVLVPLKKLLGAPWNPEGRSQLKSFRKLAESMDSIGLISPIIIDRTKTIIEGHRRVAAARFLEWLHIPAIITDKPAEHVYADMNSTSKRLSGNDALCVFLKNRLAVTDSMRKATDKMISDIGRARVEKIAKAGLSSRVYRTAKSVSTFCTIEDVGKIVDWLVRHSGSGMIGRIMKSIEAGVGATAIKNAYKQNRPVRVTLS